MSLLKRQHTVAVAVIMLLTVLLVVLRLICLDADAYPRLSWSSALLTDEGFYIHNARNLVLFGQTRTDDFNNMLIMPLLHAIQVGVFRAFGVGVIQARSITVVLSLVTLGVYFVALRRTFGRTFAWIGVFLLGLDPVFLLYSRMALMDVPACLPLCAALLAWSHSSKRTDIKKYRSLASPSAATNLTEQEIVANRQNGQRGLFSALFLSGVFFGVAYAVRGLAGIAAVGPFLVLARDMWRKEEGSTGRLLAYTAGLACVLALYGWIWWLPHRAELARVNGYYVGSQLLPRTAARFVTNLYNAFLGDDRGMAPYLFRHTPVTFGLTLLWLIDGLGWCSPKERLSVQTFASSWLLMMWLFLACISYAPDRYYVEFYPAMCLLATLALRDSQQILPRVWNAHINVADRPIYWKRALLVGWTTYHVIQSILHSKGALTIILIYGLALLVTATLALAPLNVSQWRERFAEVCPYTHSPLATFFLVLWVLASGAWLTDWLCHIAYTQRDADRWLARNLPVNSVLIGDVAPGICLNNRFRAVSVIPGLCNDIRPLQRFAPAPRYIVILDGRFKEEWWNDHYPALLRQENRLHLFPKIVRLPVGVYNGVPVTDPTTQIKQTH